MGRLREMMSYFFDPPNSKGAIQDLEHAMRTKGVVLSPEEEEALEYANLVPPGVSILGSAVGSFGAWFLDGLGDKLLGTPPAPWSRFFVATGTAFIMGKGFYHIALHGCPEMILKMEGRMKMELANIILSKHSEDVYLTNVVKKYFFTEHFFDDLHQDQPLLRWHPRCSYTDSAFVERMKESEATNSDDEARPISAETNVNIRPFGDLMEDPLACILGSPGGNMESNNPPEKTSTVLKRSELRTRRRGHRHADDKFAAF